MAVAVEAGSWSPDVEEAARKTRERHRSALTGRERLVGAPFGIALLLAAVIVGVLVDDPRPLQAAPVLAFLAAFTVAARVEFQTGAGYAVPTQLVFVPMLFALPAPAVPLVVGAGYVLARALETPRPPLGPERVVGEFANAWYTLAPVLIITLAGAERPELRFWAVYLAALAAQLLLDAATAALRAGLAFGTHPLELLRELRFAQRLDLVLAPLGLLAALAAHDQPWAWLLVLPLLGLIALFGRERSSLIDNQLELARAYRGTALLLGEVVEADDEYTGRHSQGVGQLALDVADHMGLDDATRRDIEFGGLLHDVGKIALPKSIINKTGPLDAEEWELMRTHTIQGQRMLQRIGGVLDTVGVIVRASHESWDGTGYPDGLAGEEIPLPARIISCCDAFSAITTDRSYRRGRTVAEAVAELRSCAGTQFDPAVVDAVVEVLARGADADAPPDAGASGSALDRLVAELEGGQRAGSGAPPRELIDAVDDAVVLHDAGGRAQLCNPSAEVLLGLRRADLLTALGPGGEPGLVDEDCRPVPLEDHPWRRALATGAPSGPTTLGVRGRGGSIVWSSVTARPLRRRGATGAVVTSLTDLGEPRLLDGELRELADRDPRTGLANRARFEQELARQVERSRRYGERALLLVVDLEVGAAGDDPQAHRALDAAARAAGETLRGCMRSGDVLGRLSEERFAALLPGTGAPEGEDVARKVHAAVAAARARGGEAAGTFSARVGFAAIDADAPGVADLLDRAEGVRGATAAPPHAGRAARA